MNIVEQVLVAFNAGAVTRREIAAATNLDLGLVEAAVDILLRTGQLDTHNLKSNCGVGGCNECAEDRTCAPRPELFQIVQRPLN
jgi:hypothetical protein